MARPKQPRRRGPSQKLSPSQDLSPSQNLRLILSRRPKNDAPTPALNARVGALAGSAWNAEPKDHSRINRSVRSGGVLRGRQTLRHRTGLHGHLLRRNGPAGVAYGLNPRVQTTTLLTGLAKHRPGGP
jgi:hypothetical protein